MNIEPIGIMTLIISILCLYYGLTVSVYIFIPITLLGSAAAVILGPNGQIQPAHFLLVIVVISAVLKPVFLGRFIKNMFFPKAGFWLMSIAVIGLVTSIILPRLFYGSTQIFAVGNTDFGPSIMLTPLGPVGGNITQPMYIISDLFCFLLIMSIASDQKGFAAVTVGVMAHAVINIAFAAVDIVTYYSETGYILDFIRNAQYSLHLEEETAGLKRIAGSFSETSAFSYTTLGAFGFTATLWLYKKCSMISGTTAALSLVMLILSTSSTAIVCLPILVLILYIISINSILKGKANKRQINFLLSFPLLISTLSLGSILNKTILSNVSDFLNVLIFEKSTSQSGLERSSWNDAAINNFYDTYMLGAGLGSVRASSFTLAVLANIGIAGSLLFAIFFGCVLLGEKSIDDPNSIIRTASRIACIGMLAAASVSGTLVDLGLYFFVLAGIACSYQGASLHRNNYLHRQESYLS